MKNLIEFDTFINEAKEVGTLYHFTTITNLVQIIKSNSLRGSERKDLNKNAVSFTREKYLPFVIQTKLSGGTPEVVIVIDGDKLTNRYKTQPYQYGGSTKGKAGEKIRKNVGDEREEIVLADKIEKLDLYIKKIYFIDVSFKNFEPTDSEAEILKSNNLYDSNGRTIIRNIEKYITSKGLKIGHITSDENDDSEEYEKLR